MTQYVLLDSNNKIINKIMYDPSGNWSPPSGQTVGSIPDNVVVQVGGTWDDSTYKDPSLPIIPDDVKKVQNKEKAKQFLAESDWVGLADAREKLSNVSAWDTYRTALREFIVNPKADSIGAIRKTKPDVIWK